MDDSQNAFNLEGIVHGDELNVDDVAIETNESVNLRKFQELLLLANSKNSTPTLMFPGSISCELSALLNLKYKLKQYIFRFCPTKYRRKPKKINTDHLYYKGTMFPSLRAQIPTYNIYENYSITTDLSQP
jgi:hypothetical protein